MIHMTARDLIEGWITRLTFEQEQLRTAQRDQPIAPVIGRLIHTVGTLYVYELKLPAGRSLDLDSPLSIVPQDDLEPTEGMVLSCRDGIAVVQTIDAIGQNIEGATVVPDRGGFLSTSTARLTEMLSQPDSYRLGPADRLAPLLEGRGGFEESGGSASSVLTTMWSEDQTIRRQKIASLSIELIRANKR